MGHPWNNFQTPELDRKFDNPCAYWQVEEKRAVSQDLELWISKEAVKDGYNLVVRTGRLVQEIHVTTDLPSEGMKESVQRVLRQLV